MSAKGIYIAGNIRYLRLKNGMSQDDLADRLGYKSFTTIQKWESGMSTPPLEIFVKMADMFEVDLDEFARTDLSVSEQDSAGFRKVKASSVPLYGRIPAGTPLEAIEDISEYIPIPESNVSPGSEYFYLSVKGNSMYPKYEDGDIVLFEHMNVCESGDDCAVRLDGEDATFKKVRKLDKSVILQPINPEYDPIQIDNSDVANESGNGIGLPDRVDQYDSSDDSNDSPAVEILGVAREIRRRVK